MQSWTNAFIILTSFSSFLTSCWFEVSSSWSTKVNLGMLLLFLPVIKGFSLISNFHSSGISKSVSISGFIIYPNSLNFLSISINSFCPYIELLWLFVKEYATR